MKGVKIIILFFIITSFSAILFADGKIAFISDRDGTGKKNLTNNSAKDEAPSWGR